MRFILIDARHRRAFDMQTPQDVTEAFIRQQLRCDVLRRVDIADDVDLWVSGEPKLGGFRLPVFGPSYQGSGVLAGRTKLDDIKGLPRWLSVDALAPHLWWLTMETARPAGLPRPASLTPYHRWPRERGERAAIYAAAE